MTILSVSSSQPIYKRFIFRLLRKRAVQCNN
nr:MAG TPA: hypothetical protein [Caudoviricetes sp.]